MVESGVRANIGTLEAGGYHRVVLETARGEVEAHWYPIGHSRSAVIYVGGVGGGFDTPADRLYPRLCQELTGQAIAGLRVRFRDPVDLDGCMYDVLKGLEFLEEEGLQVFGFVGHSFGGAVVLQAASKTPAARTVVTLATQAYGAEAVRSLPSDCSLLLIHGEQDPVLHPSASERVHSMASVPKRLLLLPQVGHGLDEAADRVHDEVYEWLVRELSGG